MPERPANTVQAVEHTCALLQALYDLDGAGVTELADRIDLSKSTIHNHLGTLEHNGYVVREGPTFHLSYRFLTLGGMRRDANQLYRNAKVHVEELAEETGELVAVSTEEHGMNVYLDLSAGQHAVATDIHLGTRLPLHSLASGKAILAAFPDERVAAIIDEHGLPPSTPNTITDRDQLFEELELTRERGYAIDNEERIAGMRAVAAAVRDEADGSVMGAIVVAGSTNRVAGEYFRETLPELVARRAREIEINVTYA